MIQQGIEALHRTADGSRNQDQEHSSDPSQSSAARRREARMPDSADRHFHSSHLTPAVSFERPVLTARIEY
jgi:hypothetical protein